MTPIAHFGLKLAAVLKHLLVNLCLLLCTLWLGMALWVQQPVSSPWNGIVIAAWLGLAMSVFLNHSAYEARLLLEEKTHFRELERAYSATHLARLSDNTVQSIETSSLHIDLISELKRINSLLCSIAYPILESAGALAPSRLKLPSEPV